VTSDVNGLAVAFQLVESRAGLAKMRCASIDTALTEMQRKHSPAEPRSEPSTRHLTWR
jgi:hypothetical protein